MAKPGNAVRPVGRRPAVTRVLRSVALACMLLAPPHARADAAADWNRIALDTVTRSGERLGYGLHAMAVVHVAMFETLNFIEAGYAPRFVVGSPGLDGVSSDAAAAAAAHRALVELYPNRRAALTAALEVSIRRLPVGQATTSGATTGTSIAAVICAVRALARGAEERPTDRSAPSLAGRRTLSRLEPWLFNGADPLGPADGVALRGTLRTRRDDDANARDNRVGAVRTGGRMRAGERRPVADPLRWNLVVAESIAARGLSPTEGARIHALVSMVVADAYASARDSADRCAPCIASAAAATILESALGAGDGGKPAHTDEAMGREIGEYALRRYFRPLVQPAHR
jgi:hypothetical protein